MRTGIRLKKLIWIIIICAILSALFVAYTFGAKITIEKQLEVYSSLKGIATVIFGVMGAWIAIVYPNALKNIFSKSYSLEQVNSSLKKIFFPMRVATVIVILSLLQEWLAPVLYKVDYLKTNVELVRLISFFVLTILVIFLLWSLLLTLLPMEDAEQEVGALSEHLNQTEKKKGRTTKRKINK